MSHTHTHTIEVIVDVRMTSFDVMVGTRMTSLPVYTHTECDTRLVMSAKSLSLLNIATEYITSLRYSDA